jgi:hydrogenase maturation factor
MLGFYENFPENIHRIESFTSFMSSKQLQQRIVRALSEINRKTFSFEEVSNPSVPECAVIFEVGIADAKSFNYIDEEEAKKVLNALQRAPFQVIDFFCAIRYYKNKEEKRAPLKFDYYLMRVLFDKNTMEMRVFHERGPRYISPEDIVTFLVNKINEHSARKILRRLEPS